MRKASQKAVIARARNARSNLKIRDCFASLAMTGRVLGVILILWINASPAHATYYDEVALGAGEIFEAAKQVLGPYGIRKADAKKKYLESKWQEDTVEHSRGLLRNVLKQRYHRRWRLEVFMRERDGLTEVEIKGLFQERNVETGPSIPWRRVKTTALDHQIEREVFFHILTQIEALRKSRSQNPQTVPAGGPPS